MVTMSLVPSYTDLQKSEAESGATHSPPSNLTTREREYSAARIPVAENVEIRAAPITLTTTATVRTD
jgi:hypothetical protein